ncbi:unnamed protein product [Adineta ricciae]|uniref:Uncharacterized protein n=1 Tax=Adineta ricciae TaxID=249248 RepID=A0A815LG14_ADIRI|nr:unnamed protein product [Adineta ricciae]
MARGVRNLAQSFNKHITTVYKTIFQIVFTVVMSSLSIAALWVGLERRSQCPIQTKIPMWLIVYGGFGVITSLFTIVGAVIRCLCCSKEDAEKKCDLCVRAVNTIMVLFGIAWIIVGSVWVFKVKASVQFTDPTALNTYCEKHMFNFVFAMLLLFYSTQISFAIHYIHKPVKCERSEFLTILSLVAGSSGILSTALLIFCCHGCGFRSK